MAQGLVAARGVGVVVAVALQVVEEQVGHAVVAVPRVLGRAAFVAAVRALLAAQAVVLDVVHHLQQLGAVGRLHEQEGQHRPAQPGHQAGVEQHRHGPGLQAFVAPVPGAQATAGQALALQLPGRAQAAEHGARQEGPEALAQAGAGGVFRRGDAAVVAAVVFHEEVAIRHRRQHQARQPALPGGVLVAQLVGGVDGHAVDAAHGQHQADEAGQPQAAMHRQPRAVQREPELQRHEEQQHGEVPAVRLQRGHQGLGRVAAVFAQQRVQQRDQRVHHGRQQPQPEGVTAAVGLPDVEPGQAGEAAAEQPGVALGVTPGRRRGGGEGGSHTGMLRARAAPVKGGDPGGSPRLQGLPKAAAAAVQPGGSWAAVSGGSPLHSQRMPACSSRRGVKTSSPLGVATVSTMPSRSNCRRLLSDAVSARPSAARDSGICCVCR
mmetsp:Transcript_5265/g.19716  ORF Transcript_5265/g.19716 Transcript_5265/m.19716 type:complete len:435 (+) Transcript_5265:1636-2940(+)